MATIIDHATGTVYAPGGAVQVAHNWWALLIRGLLAVGLGIYAFVAPGITAYALVFAFGFYALLDGVFNVVAGIRTRKESKRWWTLLLSGALGIAAAVIAFTQPDATAVALVFIVAAWAIVTGVLEIVAAVKLREEIRGEWLLGLAGLASVVLGVAMIAAPGTGLLAWVYLFGFYALLTGGTLIALGFRLRSLNKRLEVREGPASAHRERAREAEAEVVG